MRCAGVCEAKVSGDEITEWVAFYESQGLTYFPLYGITNGACRCKAGKDCGGNTGKHPIYPWKGQASRKPRSTDNIGISTDPLIVIDLDGDVGESSLADYPRTFTTSTGHGYHLWYRADPSKAIKSLVGWKPKVDIRAMGGLLVVPPSRHRNGGTYRHVHGETIQPVPKWLLDELPEKGETKRRIGHEVVVSEQSTHPVMVPIIQRLVEQMESWDQSRNATLFRLACRYFELADAKLLGADALQELFDAAMRTGLTSDEIERTLLSASKSV